MLFWVTSCVKSPFLIRSDLYKDSRPERQKWYETQSSWSVFWPWCHQSSAAFAVPLASWSTVPFFWQDCPVNRKLLLLISKYQRDVPMVSYRISLVGKCRNFGDLDCHAVSLFCTWKYQFLCVYRFDKDCRCNVCEFPDRQRQTLSRYKQARQARQASSFMSMIDAKTPRRSKRSYFADVKTRQ